MVSKPRIALFGIVLSCLALGLASRDRLLAEPQSQDDSRPDIVVTLSGAQRPLVRLAIPAASFRGVVNGEGAAAGREIESTIRADLDSSRIFVIQGVAELAVLQLSGDDDRDRELFRSLGNEVVLEMDLQEEGDRLVLEGRVVDLESGQTVLGKRYRGQFSLARRIAHTLADEVVQYFSQQPGIALSTISFVSDRQAPYQQKEIYLMDYDGWNQRPITAHRSLSLAPDWSPDGQLLAYVTYVRGSPGIFVADFRRNGEKRALVTDGTLNSSPSFAPDGRRFALTRSTGGSSQIYVADTNGGGLRQLTYSPGIDTSPAWSPGGREIAFTSSRSGSPQIYVMDSEGANLRRISTQGSYNDGAAWSPDGTRLAYASRRRGTFNIAITDLVTLETSLVTAGRSSDESPVYSPDGRKIAFASTRSYRRRRETQVYVVDVDGANLKQLTSEGNNYSPAWSRRRP
ncbi:MAG: Tol-Pal system beta propeller repeat protein TolB [Thermoanaerobaculia bacterium]